MVVGVGDEDVEHDPPPQRLHVRLWCSSVLAQRVRLVPQYLRRFLVVGANGALSGDHAEITEIRVPRHIEPTGVLDLDTLAIGYYKYAIEWAELCKDAGVDNQMLTRPTKEEDFKERTPAAFKPALVWQLGHAYVDLDRLRYFLSGVTLYTSAGKTYDAVAETQTYEASLKQLKDSADAVQSDMPPDFITAHILIHSNSRPLLSMSCVLGSRASGPSCFLLGKL